MSDSSLGSGWWRASDGKWYPPELYPAAPASEPAADMPAMAGNPWGNLHQGIGGQTSTAVLQVDGPRDLQFPGQKRWRRARPGAIVIGVVVVLVVFAVFAPLAGHVVGELSRHSPRVPSADQIPVPSTPPTSLEGRPMNPQGLSENTAWGTLVSRVAAASTASFGAVYGDYPPPELPTSQTFLVIAAQPTGGIGDIPGEMRRQMSGVQSVVAGSRGADVGNLPLRTSLFDGQIECVSVTLTKGSVGECLWITPVNFIELVTFSGDLQAVSILTEQIVTELHDHSTFA